jgi:hypothetical protein
VDLAAAAPSKSVKMKSRHVVVLALFRNFYCIPVFGTGCEVCFEWYCETT